MKKVFLFLILATLFMGCTSPTFENSVSEPEKFTTYYIQNLPKDTIVVAKDIDNKKDIIYVFNEETNLVEYQVHVINNHSDVIPVGIIPIIMMIIFLIGVIVGALFNN